MDLVIGVSPDQVDGMDEIGHTGAVKWGAE
jgi:hypothetical protein